MADPTPTGGGLPRVSTGGCFYEEDEPVEKIRAAFDGGEKGVTAAPDETPEDVYRAAAEAFYAGMGYLPEAVEVMAEAMAERGHFRAAVAAAYAAGREATLADLRNRPACDCGHEFEPDPSWFHLDECSYRRGAVAQQPIERGSADA